MSAPRAGERSLLDDLRFGAGSLGSYFGMVGRPALRIGVTGLSRAGKTVFITGMVHALVTRSRLPAFRAQADGRIREAKLAQHGDDALPRFAYEDHLAALTAPERHWPNSTRQISALRLEIGYQSERSSLGGLFGPAGWIGGGPSTLDLDIVDYPGEWLLDLPLLGKSYGEWSRETLAKAETGVRKALFAPYLKLLAGVDASESATETRAKTLAEAFTQALRACREEGRGLSALAPGRFLMPGDLDGAPALTFAPIKPGDGEAPSGSLAALMVRRFEAYKARVIKPFFSEHFARLDRQIVLIDVLSALNGGQEALADLENALVDVLEAFNVGSNSLWTSLFAPRISRILFAATKADHLHHSNHDRLEGVLNFIVRRAWHRAKASGAETGMVALAAIRATREVSARVDGEDLACVAGIPIAGEMLDGRCFDGKSEVALFPGDLPDAAEEVFAGGTQLRFLGFRPPLVGAADAIPSIRLDRAIEFLIGDQLA